MKERVKWVDVRLGEVKEVKLERVSWGGRTSRLRVYAKVARLMEKGVGCWQGSWNWTAIVQLHGCVD